jgi:uncharacterized protein YjdB/putative hemolysin
MNTKSIVSLLMVFIAINSFAQKGFKNPAAAYAHAMGYEFKTKTDAQGNEFGVTILPGGTEVKAWDFFKGKVAPEYSYCNKKGYLVKTKVISEAGFSTECAVCYSNSNLKSGTEIPMMDLMQQNGDLPDLTIGKNPEIQAIENAKVSPELKSTMAIPTSFDWRSNNGHSYIGPVRNQGDCGSCYSFGATATAEGVYNYATGKYDSNCADFAEAYIAFCLGSMSAYSSNFSGCDGADYSYSELQALVDIGICNETYFPYSETASSCPSAATNATKTKFANWYRVSCSDIAAIKTAIMTYGVVDAAVYVDAAFQNYTSGIFSNTSTTCTGSPCANTTTNHAIALVGWGNDATLGDYWILRNSWGSTWGESGYMRIAATSARVACSVAYLTYSNVNVPVTGVSVSPTTLQIGVGATSTLTATLSPTNASNQNVTWTSSNTSIATVSASGLVTAIAVGSATITATTQDGSFTSTCLVTVSTAPITYCTSKGTTATYEWIKGVTIGSFSNASVSNSGYGDFTSLSVALSTNNTYSITLTPGFNSTTYNEYWKIWIDFNHNGTLDDSGELVFDQGGYSKTAVTGNITIPASALTGTTRMRVAMKYISGSTVSGPTACETFSYGEVEDYTVNISTGQSTTIGVPSGLAASSITSSSATLSWGAVSTATSYDVRYKTVAGSTWTTTNTTATSLAITGLTASTQYEFQVSAKNSSSSSAYSASTTFTTLASTIAYCTAKGGTTYEWISQVQLGSINNTTGANGGYADFTSLSTSIAIGSSQTIYFKPGFSSTIYSENWKVWIDYNKDGDFTDTGEEVVSGSGSTTSLLSATFTVPATATIGATRMRVAMIWSSTPTSCGTFSYGEFEDYTVNITAVNAKAEPLAVVADSEPIKNELSQLAFNVHPNPATNELFLNLDGIRDISAIKIMDTQGKMVMKLSNPKGNNTLDISKLINGTYIIVVETERGQLKKIFIKQ